MPRFYIEADLAIDQAISLTETVFHHWVKVLRAQVGERATLFNGQGGEYEATLIDIQKKSAQVKLQHFNPDNRTPPLNTVLGQVMSKGDRMDYAIQKAVELGVTEIQLLTSERCEMRLKYERDQKKLNHWQAIAIAACEQCGMNIVPKILAPIALADWILQQDSITSKFVLAPNTESQQGILEQIQNNVALLIGPEGGLSDAEIDASEQVGFTRWCIGERVLRTETAPIVALSILLHHSHNKC